jgi:hypothetical protein
MTEFNAQSSVTVGVSVYVTSLLITILCISSVVVGLTWDGSSQMAVNQNTPSTRA